MGFLAADKGLNHAFLRLFEMTLADLVHNGLMTLAQ